MVPATYRSVPDPLPEPVLQQMARPCRRRCWKLQATYRCVLPTGAALEIPAGYLYDLASIPRLFWRLIAPHELSTAAPLVHDFLYDHAGRVPGHEVGYTKADADAIFHAIMERQRVPWLIRSLAYLAVSLFGRYPSLLDEPAETPPPASYE